MSKYFFKSAFNGIGSGAGVAWPFFGIVFTLLGGSIGSLFSLALGSVAVGLFCMVCFPVIYFSYQGLKEEKRLLHRKFQKNEKKLTVDMCNYIKNIRQAYGSEKTLGWDEYFSSRIIQDLQKTKEDSPLYKCLSIISKKYKQSQCIPSTQCVIQDISAQVMQQRVPWKKMLVPVFFDFVGTFGSIAGCSAGFSGMLTGIGVFSSFAAFPLLGWGVIAGAVLGGLFSAANGYATARETFQQRLLNQTLKEIHGELNRKNKEDFLNTAPDVKAESQTGDTDEPVYQKVQESREASPLLENSGSFLPGLTASFFNSPASVNNQSFPASVSSMQEATNPARIR